MVVGSGSRSRSILETPVRCERDGWPCQFVARLTRPTPADRGQSGHECEQFGRHQAELRRGAVLVDETAEHVTPSNVAERRGRTGHRSDGRGYAEFEPAVRAVLVVVPDVVA
jgi:hypothetical protein